MWMNRSPVIVAIKIAIIVWGLVSVVMGTGLVAFGLTSREPNEQWTEYFIYIVYFSVFAGGLASLFSSTIATILLCVTIIAAVGILISTNGLGEGSHSIQSWGPEIAIRPVIVALILGIASRVENPI